MSANVSNRPISTMEYFDWVAAQKFKNSQEHHLYVSEEEQNFLQYVIYPMFYHDSTFETPIPFPIVSKTYSTRYPKYVINNEHFTVFFFSYDNYDDEKCWEVSVHIKDHEFCDIPIREFKSWYSDHYSTVYCEMEGMPKRFLYPKLNPYSKDVEDFCIEFWNYGRDFMLFKLLDLLRIY